MFRTSFNVSMSIHYILTMLQLSCTSKNHQENLRITRLKGITIVLDVLTEFSVKCAI